MASGVHGRPRALLAEEGRLVQHEPRQPPRADGQAPSVGGDDLGYRRAARPDVEAGAGATATSGLIDKHRPGSPGDVSRRPITWRKVSRSQFFRRRATMTTRATPGKCSSWTPCPPPCRSSRRRCSRAGSFPRARPPRDDDERPGRQSPSLLRSHPKKRSILLVVRSSGRHGVPVGGEQDRRLQRRRGNADGQIEAAARAPRGRGVRLPGPRASGAAASVSRRGVQSFAPGALTPHSSPLSIRPRQHPQHSSRGGRRGYRTGRAPSSASRRGRQ